MVMWVIMVLPRAVQGCLFKVNCSSFFFQHNPTCVGILLLFFLINHAGKFFSYPTVRTKVLLNIVLHETIIDLGY